MSFANPQHNIEQLELNHGMKVADVGTGSGTYVLMAAKIVGDNGKVYAVDIQHELLSKLRTESKHQNIHNIEFVWGDAEKKGGTKIKDAVADAVIISNVLFQVENKRGMIFEVARLLKPGGKMMVIDWTDSFGGLGPRPKDVFAKVEAKSLLMEAGMSLLKEFDAGAHHYGFIFVKKNESR